MADRPQDDKTPINRLPTPRHELLSNIPPIDLSGVSGINLSGALLKLAEAPSDDIKQITAAQITIVTEYYKSVLVQASLSFRSALIFSGVGVLFFLGAIIFILVYQLQDAALLSATIGTIIEAISGLNFWLYGKSTSQLAHYHHSLNASK